MKKIIVILAFLIATLSGCTNKPDSPPEIIVMSGSTVIDTIVGKNKWNGSVFDRQDNFIALMENKEKSELPYIELNEDISIEFTDNIPDSVILKDYIINPNGETKYSEDEVIEIPLEFSNGSAIFKLEENMAAFLSSDSSDYEQGGVIRGFKLTCSWGANECEYAFILRTDAYDMSLNDPWLQIPSQDPVETVRSALENQINKEYTISVEVQNIEIDEAETARVIEYYSNSELAEARGWTNEYLAEHFIVIKAIYDTEYDHSKTPLDDGSALQYFYLTQDIESGEWTISDNTAPIIGID